MTVAAGERLTDTIAAIATATGPAAVGIVRLSGPDAFSIIDRLTYPSLDAGKRIFADGGTRGHTLRRAVIHDPEDGEAIDDVLVAIFRAPRSLTGEDVVEIQGHGGTITLKRVFAACLSSGARAARAGEFSERSFVNGKMDLAQAEAIADLVSAGTVAAQRAAARQATGALSRALHQVAEELKSALAAIEASIDFPEEIGEIDSAAVGGNLDRATRAIGALMATASYGRRLRDGMTVVLTGRPNVGKSSLLNALSGAERSIVTAIPGTTRDIVEEALHLDGIPVRALDTAGLRDTVDPVESIGVERARAAVATADVTIVVLDAAAGVTADDRRLLAWLADRPFVVALNKADLVTDRNPLVDAIKAIVGDRISVVLTVASASLGLDGLSRAIVELVAGSRDHGAVGLPLVTSARHEEALRRAAASISEASVTLRSGLPPELIAVDIYAALQSLGEITGETAREEIVAGIFARFCIGK